MNSTKLKSIILFLSFCLIFGLFPGKSLAETAQLSVDIHPKEIHQGEVFTINLTFTSSSNPIGTINALIVYDDDLIEYQSGGSNTVQISGGSGMITDTGSPSTKEMIYSLNFIAKKSGTASFAVTESEVIALDTGTLLGNPEKSISISIQPESHEEVDKTITVYINGKVFYVFKQLTDIKLPEGFETTVVTLQGEEITGAKNPSTGLILLYAADENLQEGWYIYDPSTEMLYPYITVNVDQVYILIPLDINPEGYQPAEIEINGILIPVLKPDDFKGYYLVKASNEQGDTGYYFYDEREGTIQRVWLEEAESENREVIFTITALAVICIILLLLIILLAYSFRPRRKRRKH